MCPMRTYVDDTHGASRMPATYCRSCIRHSSSITRVPSPDRFSRCAGDNCSIPPTKSQPGRQLFWNRQDALDKMETVVSAFTSTNPETDLERSLESCPMGPAPCGKRGAITRAFRRWPTSDSNLSGNQALCPRTSFERSGLAFGFSHGRFACGNFVPVVHRTDLRSAPKPAPSLLCGSPLFPSSYN